MSGAEDLTYDQLTVARKAVSSLQNSAVLFITERDRMGEVLQRIDSAVQLPRIGGRTPGAAGAPGIVPGLVLRGHRGSPSGRQAASHAIAGGNN
jgi:hypothetical protein